MIYNEKLVCFVSFHLQCDREISITLISEFTRFVSLFFLIHLSPFPTQILLIDLHEKEVFFCLKRTRRITNYFSFASVSISFLWSQFNISVRGFNFFNFVCLFIAIRLVLHVYKLNLVYHEFWVVSCVECVDKTAADSVCVPRQPGSVHPDFSSPDSEISVEIVLATIAAIQIRSALDP